MDTLTFDAVTALGDADVAADDALAQHPATANARAAAAQLATNAAARRTMAAQIAADRLTTPEGIRIKLRELAASADATDAPSVQRFEQAVANVRGFILPFAPVHMPLSAVHAQHINGTVGDLSDSTPQVAVRIAREAVARNDLPLVQRLADRLEAFVATRQAFRDNADVSDTLDALRQSLRTSETVRSDAAKRWVLSMTQELRYLRAVLADPNDDVSMHIRTGALGLLFPQSRD